MAASIAWSDNKDATGGIVTVAGSAAGSVNSFWISRFNGSYRDRAFTQVGSRTGNGSIAVACDPGPFIGVLKSDASGSVTWTAPMTFRASDGTLPLHERIMDAVREYILGLAIPGVTADPDQHVKAKVGEKLEQLILEKPQCVYYLVDPESSNSGDNLYENVEFPVYVVSNKKNGGTLYKGLTEALSMREIVRRSMYRGALPDVPEVNRVKWELGTVIDAPRWAANLDVTVIALRAYSEQLSGIF